MSDKPRSEQGQFLRERDPTEVLEMMEPHEPYVTSELADALGWPRRTVYEVLSNLHDDGRVSKKQANSRAVMWMRSEDSL